MIFYGFEKICYNRIVICMEKYKIDDNVSGEVTGITKYGIFIKLEDDYVGLIHISEISDKYISDLSRMYVLGETVDAKIISIDENKKQIKLSCKEFNINNKAKKKKKIKEEGRGFAPLKENLSIWVNEKLEELKKI